MFNGDEIKELVELFERRGVRLYHSAQYLDFLSYLELGGIPSRSLLEENGLPMTEFVSDENDHINNVWDKVFLNPLDFGTIFKKGNGVPTVYGPIAFVFEPQALINANNVAICLRSAGCNGFNREVESLESIADVDRIFAYPYSDDPHANYRNPFIKFTKELKEEFNRDYVSNPEISIDIDGNLLEFNHHLEEILVDPYNIEDVLLVNKVVQKVKHNGIRPSVRRRSLNRISWKILPEIVDVLIEGLPTLDELDEFDNMSADFKQWVQKIKEKNLDQQWLNYAEYFRNGTLFPLMEEEGIIPF